MRPLGAGSPRRPERKVVIPRRKTAEKSARNRKEREDQKNEGGLNGMKSDEQSQWNPAGFLSGKSVD